MNKSLLSSFIITAAFLMLGCKKQEVKVPSYISIPAYDFTIQPGEGTGSQYVSDVWVYVNDQSIGAFQIPAKFPVIASGPQVVKMRAGILLSGIEDQRAAYPFFDWFIDTIDLSKGGITPIVPKFNYIQGTKMSLIYGFEPTDSVSFTRTSSSDTMYTLVSGSAALEGQYAAEINLNAERTLFEIKSSKSFPIPEDRLAFVELNCKANYPFTVGIFANDANSSIQQQVITIYPANGEDVTWKKLYVNLSSTLAQFSAATSFHIFIGALRTSDATVDPKIYLDNIKLVGI